MRYEFSLGLRYFLGRRKDKFISIISLISVIGIATGVATLIIVIGVMSGFDHELSQRIIGTNSHIVVDKIGGLDDAGAVMERLAKIEHVLATAPFINTQALIQDNGQMFSVLVRGIDQELEQQVTTIKNFLQQGEFNLKSNNIVIGRELAYRLTAQAGDTIKLITPAKLVPESFRIAGIFSSGMYDFDSGLILLSLANAQEFTQMQEIVSGISVKVDDAYRAEQIKKNIQDELKFPYFTRTWMDLNRNLFNALKLEKTAMFIILTLIILVAALNIASTLIVTVIEKTKDIGILKAIGANNRSVRIVFTMHGFLIGIVGTVVGAVGGLVMVYLLKTYQFIKLPKDIYYIDRLPVRIEAMDIVWIIIATLGISLLSTVYPAHQAARLNPVEALRYE